MTNAEALARIQNAIDEARDSGSIADQVIAAGLEVGLAKWKVALEDGAIDVDELQSDVRMAAEGLTNLAFAL